jgi:hypothetical protein
VGCETAGPVTSGRQRERHPWSVSGCVAGAPCCRKRRAGWCTKPEAEWSDRANSGVPCRRARLRVVSLVCALLLRLHQQCDAIAGWLGAAGTGQDGLELRGQEISCAATALIACLVGCLQSRVRDRCLSGVGGLPKCVCTTTKRSPAAGGAVPATGDAMGL